eukprot:CAMPEP_0182900614 /NCGR_PEP_ID=MMETSP0034_2-20130328/28980_1 /TAXON_ID=156128 /ORGANISM="Nephroselmis pyriformis, Strain CCMP717" /LENGTH=310 /DNA_ID=CAMNT_0025034857 /DNA_START=36 /DNA_END=965 /DNA_ORIENTATION=-
MGREEMSGVGMLGRASSGKESGLPGQGAGANGGANRWASAASGVSRGFGMPANTRFTRSTSAPDPNRGASGGGGMLVVGSQKSTTPRNAAASRESALAGMVVRQIAGVGQSNQAERAHIESLKGDLRQVQRAIDSLASRAGAKARPATAVGGGARGAAAVRVRPASAASGPASLESLLQRYNWSPDASQAAVARQALTDLLLSKAAEMQEELVYVALSQVSLILPGGGAGAPADKGAAWGGIAARVCDVSKQLGEGFAVAKALKGEAEALSERCQGLEEETLLLRDALSGNGRPSSGRPGSAVRSRPPSR